MTAPAQEALTLQRPAPNDLLMIVARGSTKDEAGENNRGIHGAMQSAMRKIQYARHRHGLHTPPQFDICNATLLVLTIARHCAVSL